MVQRYSFPNTTQKYFQKDFKVFKLLHCQYEYMQLLVIFKQFFALFTTDIGSVTSLLNEIMIQRYSFQTLNNILIIALHIGVLAIFCKFWAHFGLINSSRWLSDRIFV